jgi:predicted nucleic acid-binding protein
MHSGKRIFVDTSVLVAADDAANAQRRTQVRGWLAHLWAARLGRVSTQVLNEYYVCVTQRIQPGLTQGDARAKLRRYQLWQPWVIDHQTVETAWGLEVRHQIDYWQALILASAVHSGCEAILSDALPLVQYDQLSVINPFKTPPPIETSA